MAIRCSGARIWSWLNTAVVEVVEAAVATAAEAEELAAVAAAVPAVVMVEAEPEAVERVAGTPVEAVRVEELEEDGPVAAAAAAVTPAQ